MRRIATETRQLNKFGPGKDGFTNGDPIAGVSSTDLQAEWFDALQEELAAVIEAAGLELDPDDNAQLLAALQVLFLGGTALAEYVKTTALTAALAEYVKTTALSTALAGYVKTTALNTALTSYVQTSAFTNGQSLETTGYQRLPGGLILQWGRLSVASATAVIFPIAFPGAVCSVTASNCGAGSGTGNISINVGADLSTSGVTLYARNENSNGLSVDVMWQAIGY